MDRQQSLACKLRHAYLVLHDLFDMTEVIDMFLHSHKGDFT